MISVTIKCAPYEKKGGAHGLSFCYLFCRVSRPFHKRVQYEKQGASDSDRVDDAGLQQLFPRVVDPRHLWRMLDNRWRSWIYSISGRLCLDAVNKIK